MSTIFQQNITNINENWMLKMGVIWDKIPIIRFSLFGRANFSLWLLERIMGKYFWKIRFLKISSLDLLKIFCTKTIEFNQSNITENRILKNG